MLLLVIYACGPSESRVESGNRLGILHLGNGTEPQSIDPHVSTGVSENRIIQSVFEGLVAKNPYTLEIEPGVAESWKVSDDGLVYTFKLRDNARWSNGDMLTAEDYRWSWQRALHPKMANQYAYMLFPIVNASEFNSGKLKEFDKVGVTVLGTNILQVTLSYPTPYFLQILDHHSSYAVHKPTLEKFGSPYDRYSLWTRPGHFVGNGSFVLSDWQLYRHIRVEKNPNYWDAGKVQLNQVIFYPTENVVTEERMFRVGQLHVSSSMPLPKIPEYRKYNPNELRNAPYLGTYYYQFNVSRPPFDNVLVRRALGLAIDREQITKNVMFGSATPAYSMVPPGVIGYKPPSLFNYDPDEARRLLAAAGYVNGKGFPVVELLYNTNESHRKIAVAIQQMWKKELNIDVSIVNQEWKVYLQSRTQLDYDIARAGWIGDVLDPINFLDLGLSTNGNNSTGFIDSAYDEMITATIPSAKSHEERLQFFYEAETYLMNAAPFIPIYRYQVKYLIDESVVGMPANLMDHFNYKYIRLEG